VSVAICVAGKLPKNHEVLREAYSLCHRLPIMNTPKFREEFYSVRYPYFLLFVAVFYALCSGWWRGVVVSVLVAIIEVTLRWTQ